MTTNPSTRSATANDGESHAVARVHRARGAMSHMCPRSTPCRRNVRSKPAFVLRHDGCNRRCALERRGTINCDPSIRKKREPL